MNAEFSAFSHRQICKIDVLNSALLASSLILNFAASFLCFSSIRFHDFAKNSNLLQHRHQYLSLMSEIICA